MDPVTTARALRVMVGGKTMPGKVAWAEGGKVLVYDLNATLAYSTKVTVTVGTGARSTLGFRLPKEIGVSYTTEAKPVPVRVATTTTTRARTTAGQVVGSSSWVGVENWYLGLMNCNRGGGLVTDGGGCVAAGGATRPALFIDPGISARVSRPYAKVLAQLGACGHYADGSAQDRLRRGGYGGWSAYGENVGCLNYGSAQGGALWSHLQFQAERSYNGGHWANIMSTRFDRVGIGVWVASGRVRLVVDFYRP
jgi:hypothetical protein